MLLPYARQQCKINRMLNKYPDRIKIDILDIIIENTKGNKPFSIEPIQVTDIGNLQSIYHSYSNCYIIEVVNYIKEDYNTSIVAYQPLQLVNIIGIPIPPILELYLLRVRED